MKILLNRFCFWSVIFISGFVLLTFQNCGQVKFKRDKNNPGVTTQSACGSVSVNPASLDISNLPVSFEASITGVTGAINNLNWTLSRLENGSLTDIPLANNSSTPMTVTITTAEAATFVPGTYVLSAQFETDDQVVCDQPAQFTITDGTVVACPAPTLTGPTRGFVGVPLGGFQVNSNCRIGTVDWNMDWKLNGVEMNTEFDSTSDMNAPAANMFKDPGMYTLFVTANTQEIDPVGGPKNQNAVGDFQTFNFDSHEVLITYRTCDYFGGPVEHDELWPFARVNDCGGLPCQVVSKRCNDGVFECTTPLPPGECETYNQPPGTCPISDPCPPPTTCLVQYPPASGLTQQTISVGSSSQTLFGRLNPSQCGNGCAGHADNCSVGGTTLNFTGFENYIYTSAGACVSVDNCGFCQVQEASGTIINVTVGQTVTRFAQGLPANCGQPCSSQAITCTQSLANSSHGLSVIGQFSAGYTLTDGNTCQQQNQCPVVTCPYPGGTPAAIGESRPFARPAICQPSVSTPCLTSNRVCQANGTFGPDVSYTQNPNSCPATPACTPPPPTITYGWEYGAYGACSATACGTTGTETQTFICRQFSDGNPQGVVANSFCQNSVGNPNPQSRSCSAPACAPCTIAGSSVTVPFGQTATVYTTNGAACGAKLCNTSQSPLCAVPGGVITLPANTYATEASCIANIPACPPSDPCLNRVCRWACEECSPGSAPGCSYYQDPNAPAPGSGSALGDQCYAEGASISGQVTGGTPPVTCDPWSISCQ